MKIYFSVEKYGESNYIEAKQRNCGKITLTFKAERCSAVCAALKNARFRVPLGMAELVPEFRIQCGMCREITAHDEDFVEAMVAVDLGNTRTCAVVCPDINANDALVFQRLVLTSHFAEEMIANPGKSEDNGIWNSFCVVGDSKHFFDTSASFVRVGNDAKLYTMEATKLISGEGPDANDKVYFLSSPKRYFWDDDLCKRLHALSPKDEKSWMWRPLANDTELARHIAENDFNGKMTRGLLLEGAVFDLLEQSERMLNARSKKRHIVTKLAVSYPAAWNNNERAMYAEIIKKAANRYAEQRCPAKAIDCLVECDEAAAVVLNYVYNELLFYNSPQTWLEVKGRITRSGDPRLRCCVIDIGGGTCDIAVTDISLITLAGAQRLDIKLRKVSGSDEAGDSLLGRIFKEILFEKIIDLCIDESVTDEAKQIVNQLCQEKGLFSRNRSLARSFGFQLALLFMIKCNQQYAAGKQDGFTIDFNNDISTAAPELKQIYMEVKDGISNVKAAVNALIETAQQEYSNDPAMLSQLQAARMRDDCPDITFSQAEVAAYERQINLNFTKSPMLFGKVMTEVMAECDLLIWSGKTAEITQITDIFKDFIPIPAEAQISMSNYRLNPNFPLVDLKGNLVDSKFATAIGCAIHALSNWRKGVFVNKPWNFVATDNHNTGSCCWAVRRIGMRADIVDLETLLDPKYPANNKTLVFRGEPMLFYRMQDKFSSPMPGYELRINPEFAAEIKDCNVDIKLVGLPEDKLDFELCGGTLTQLGGIASAVQNTSGFRKYFELRTRIVGDVWLDQ